MNRGRKYTCFPDWSGRWTAVAARDFAAATEGDTEIGPS